MSVCTVYNVHTTYMVRESFDKAAVYIPQPCFDIFSLSIHTTHITNSISCRVVESDLARALLSFHHMAGFSQPQHFFAAACVFWVFGSMRASIGSSRIFMGSRIFLFEV